MYDERPIGAAIGALALRELALADQDHWEQRALDLLALYRAQGPKGLNTLRLPSLLQLVRLHLNGKAPGPGLRAALEEWLLHWRDRSALDLEMWRLVRDLLQYDTSVVCGSIGYSGPTMEDHPVVGRHVARWDRGNAAHLLRNWIHERNHTSQFLGDIHSGSLRSSAYGGLTYSILTEQMMRAYTQSLVNRRVFDVVMDLLLYDRLSPDLFAAGASLRLLPAGSSTGAIWSVGPDGRWDGGSDQDLRLLPAVMP